MENIQNQSSNINEGKYKTFLKGQEILKTTINSIELDKEKYKISSSSILTNSKSIDNYKQLKSLYRKYKTRLNVSKQSIKKFSILKYEKFNEEINFSRYANKNELARKLKSQFYINKIFIAKLNFIYLIRKKVSKLRFTIEKTKINFLELKSFTSSTYLNKFLKIEKYLSFYLNLLSKNSKKIRFIPFVYNNSNKLFSWITNYLKFIIDSLKKILAKSIKFKDSFSKESLLSYLSRLGFILKIYFIPFIFLANQSLVPFIQEYEELIVSSFSNKLFEKIPLLTNLIKVFNPLINSYNKMVQFWVIIAYFLIFPTGYKSLKLSYKLGYNGSIAFIFLLINYSLGLSQEIAITIFECIKLVKDILFSNYLVKHLNAVKYKEREESITIFTNLVQRYELQVKQDYFNWLLFLNHFILSPLAFISLAVLVYNCVYYIIYNKNPKIPLVTKAALATIKNPQEEE